MNTSSTFVASLCIRVEKKDTEEMSWMETKEQERISREGEGKREREIDKRYGKATMRRVFISFSMHLIFVLKDEFHIV